MHRVPDHIGNCKAFHGHRYTAEIECSGTIKPDGMIVDFGVIKKLVGSWIDEHWDHTAILKRDDPDPAVKHIIESNGKMGRPVYLMDNPPTAEYIAEELFYIAQNLLDGTGVEVKSVIVRETPNCFASFSPGSDSVPDA